MEKERTTEITKNTTENRQNKEGFGLKQQLWEFAKFFLIAALIVVPIRLWVAQPFIVNGASMVPSFEHGEYLIIDEFSYHFRAPERGEVIVFRYPIDPSKFFIKRVVGLPKERLDISNDEIKVYNEKFPGGVTLNESYLEKELPTANMSVALGENEYFVLGDNRQMSSDSRVWGTLPADLIIGRAWIRLWPFTKLSISF